MTVRPGEDWGERTDVPVDAVSVADDRELARALNAGETRPVLLRGGDLFRTLGSPPPGVTATQLSIDELRVRADDRELTAVAHVIARNGGAAGWWRGPILAVMNAEFVGRWDVAPRAHPNDGRLDAVAVSPSMPARARWHAWRRLPSGSHLPHPEITIRRAVDGRWTFDRPLDLWLDGVPAGAVRDLTVHVQPDAATILV